MVHIRPPFWVNYAAAALILAHAGLSAYWAAGGRAGLGLMSEGIQAQANSPTLWFILMIWAVAGLKLLVGVVALGLARGWNLILPRWMLLTVLWGTGAVLFIYGGIQFITGVAVVSGVVAGPESPSTAFWAYLLLWAPLWLAIGTLYLLTALRETNLRRRYIQTTPEPPSVR